MNVVFRNALIVLGVAIILTAAGLGVLLSREAAPAENVPVQTRQVFVAARPIEAGERSGKLEQTEVRFRDAAHVLFIAQRIAADVGRRVDESSPMLDARLKDGSRVNVLLQPLAVHGPYISIRKFSRDLADMDTLRANGSISAGKGQSICRL